MESLDDSRYDMKFVIFITKYTLLLLKFYWCIDYMHLYLDICLSDRVAITTLPGGIRVIGVTHLNPAVKVVMMMMEVKILTHLSHIMIKQTFWFPTWSDTNLAVQLQEMARGLKFRI